VSLKNNFWQNKNVLITGINGFIGSHLASTLRGKGAFVWGISSRIESDEIIKTDITNYASVNSYVKEKNIVICFHLAAQSLVESGQNDPYNTFKVNILGTLNILESARKNNLERVVVASSSHVYGKSPLPYKEEYPPKPTRPYETSKTAIDLIAQSYADSFNLPVLIPRFSNIYGPGDLNFDRLIPKTIRNVLANENPLMWGGTAVRDYLYIDDAISAYIKLASLPISRNEKSRVFNFGTGNKISVRDLVDLIIEISGKNLIIKKVNNTRLSEINEQFVSSIKAKRILHWKPKVSMKQGLEKTLKWYKKYLQIDIP